MEQIRQKYTATECGNNKWIRIPSHGQEPHTGLTRGYIYTLISAGKIKSANLKQPGNITGCRLVWLPSLLEYIEKHVETAGAE